MLILKLAAVTASIPALLVAGLANLDWMVVDVREHSGQRIVVPVPLAIARAALAFVPEHAGRVNTPPELGQAAPAAAAMIEALSETPDVELVRVEQPGETVSIRKVGDTIRVEVDSPREHVRVNLPLKAARRALAGAANGRLDASAILDAIADVDGDLVQVSSANEQVRIWVW